MIRFIVDTSDYPEEARHFYHDVVLTFAGGMDDNVSDMIEKFGSFLKAIGYPEATIEKISVCD